ncbi:MAG: aspartate/glutamate racemase family protein [Terriglobia bacterium]
MPKTLAMLHTSHVLIPTFSQLCEDHLPAVEVFHLVDESLIKNTISAGRLMKSTIRRMESLIGSAREGGADAVMVTCSSIGPGVKVLRALFDFPILRIDESMADEAVRIGGKIGVLATLRTTLEPTVELLRETAAARSRRIELIPCLCEGAFDAILSGDNHTHHQIVAGSLLDLMRRADVVVLAQASMAGVVGTLQPDPGRVPVLSSPELAVRQAKELFQQNR